MKLIAEIRRFSNLTRWWLAAAMYLLWASLAIADVGVSFNGPGGQRSQSLPGNSGEFNVQMPLAKNTVNKITVTAKDENGNTASRDVTVTQISFDSLVVANVTAEPLSPERIDQLVKDGVIDIDDPANFNVSEFAIVLTIGTHQNIPIKIPVVVPKIEEPTGTETYTIPGGDGQGGGRPPDEPPVQVIVFESRPSKPGVPVPPITGVIVIDGRIKTLKEFYSVKLIMMNISGIFTLKDVNAMIEFPNGGLSNTLPADGVASLGDIAPGQGNVPGQAQKEFIIRGDEIGVRPVKVSFGGKVGGPGIPDGSEVPFNGSAQTTVEVKGPPKFTVRVTHPDTVVGGVPYKLGIEITNTGDTPALYTSLDLDVGFDAKLLDCKLDAGDLPICDEITGPAKRTFGNILPGKTVREEFDVKPLVTGAISSCMGIADQNITLQVAAGNLGCLIGQFSPDRFNPDGIPAVSVLPGNNFIGVALESPVTMFFTKAMNTASIISGPNGTVKVFDQSGAIQPGELRFANLNGDTVAVWQLKDGITNRLAPNEEYTVQILQSITDTEGKQLIGPWTSKFTTTGDGIDDFTPPSLSLAVEPPVNPNNIIPGQLAKISAYPADQGSGIQRVELRMKDLSVPDSTFKLVDQKKYTLGDTFPYFFKIDSKNLIAGHTYQLKGTAFDGVGNPGESTLALIVAAVAPIPTVTLPASPGQVLKGVPISITPLEVTGGTFEVNYLLDEAPLKTIGVAPYQVTIPTLGLDVGNHTFRAVARDGLNQTGEASLTFVIIPNNNAPVVSFVTPDSGAEIVTNTTMPISASITDPVGVKSIKWYFDDPNGAPFAQNISSFALNTTGIPLGAHTLYVVATNNLDLTTNPGDSSTFRQFSIVVAPPEPAPPAPNVTDITVPTAGETKVTGTTSPNRRVDITNITFPSTVSVVSNGSGVFTAAIAAESGNTLQLRAFNAAQDLFSAPPASVVVPSPTPVDFIEVSPTSQIFTTFNSFVDLTVTAHYIGGSTENVTAQATYTTSSSAVAGVNAAGRVAPTANGTATITATFGGKTATTNITVDVRVLQSISVTPPTIAFGVINQQQQLAVTGHFSDNTTEDLTVGTSFQTGNPFVATVSNSGLVTATGLGETDIAVSRAGTTPVAVHVSVNLDDSVKPTANISSPANNSGVQRGQTVTVNVQAADSLSGVTKVTLNASGQMSFSDTKQISPTLNTTQSFNFVVSDTAVIGGVINLSAVSEDASGNISVASVITLNVVDTTAPSVTITSPTQQQGFGFGEVVTINVEASDAVGVAQIRYQTEGALNFSDAQNFAPAPGQRTATFQFTVPFGVVDPDVKIRAYAKDASNNEQQAAAINITITDADVTPPQTVATSVTPPGAGATTTVSYSVTDGIDDLDYVLLFFRRNGIGTFNRYTNSLGGNPEGKFTPSSGNTGSIVFDSTRMGGDGSYEFYTIGVDKAGNRETDPATADQTSAFNTGAAVTVINSSTTIAGDNFSFDNLSLRITGNITVTIDGNHTFRNVELLNGARLNHSAATPTTEPGLSLNLWSLTIDASSSIDVTALGYRGGLNSGNSGCSGLTLGNAGGATFRSAGSYGGPGAVVEGATNSLYGSLADPNELGSGGSCGGNSAQGGNGGGRIAISAINVANDGVLAADGQNAIGGFLAGNGSGGAIKISAATVSGNGTMHSNGNSTGGNNEIGGGGGRIAILFTDVSTLDRSSIQALGGQSANTNGSNGTVFFSGLGETNGSLIIDGQGTNSQFTPLAIPNGFTFDNITVRNNARVIIDAPLSITGIFAVQENSIVTHSVASEAGLVINAAKVVVDSTSSIDLTGKGYRGGLNSGNGGCTGQTLPGGTGAVFRSAGSHGGYGALADGAGSIPYGDIKNPASLGSGGSCGANSTLGGNGGGRLTIQASDSVQVDGYIRADGQNGIGGFLAGNGAGGSIKITTSNLKGSGFITANGNSNNNNNELGGGGGRIAIFYDFLSSAGNDLNGTLNITAFGGKSSYANGSAGTLYLKRSDRADGDLYLDEGMSPGQTSSVVAPIGTLIGYRTIANLTADTITITGADGDFFAPNGLVGLRIRPSLTSQDEYVIIANSTNTITVDLSGHPPLTSVTAIGDKFSGVLSFANVFFRRGTFAMLGDKLKVDNLLSVAENAYLSHYNSTAGLNSKLDIEAATVQIDAGSKIDVSGRGYPGGLSRQNGGCTGITFPGLSGAVFRAAGSYGGRGARWDGTSNPTYGSVTDPVDLGSGGSCGANSIVGGDGGGALKLVAGNLVINGEINANGAFSRGGFLAGNGSGGSINLNVGTISGNGFIRANGGASIFNFGNNNEVGGGGGRVAIRYNALLFDQSHILVLGGIASNANGGHGTLFLKGPGQVNGDLIIDGALTNTPDDLSILPPGQLFDNIKLRNNVRLVIESPLVATNSIELTTGSRLTHPISFENGLAITATSLYIDPTSAIDVTGRGYRGGLNSGNGGCTGFTVGGQLGATFRSAGSYGGAGAVADGSGSNPLYGIPEEPIYLGSGGSCGGNSSLGGNGGGRLSIQLSGDLRVDGAIRADGQNGIGGFYAGNGSGGSIAIDAANIAGNGVISANGNSTGGNNEVGGGGGRIALEFDSFGGGFGDFNATRNITAYGGMSSNFNGSAGTVYFRNHGETLGDLIFDAGLASGTSSKASLFTPVGFGKVVAVSGDTLTLDQTRPVIPGGLVGVRMLPDTALPTTFVVTSNTASTVTLAPESTGPILSDVAATNDEYAGTYTYKNVTLRGGARLELDDVLRVDNTLLVSERSILTHRGATTNSTSRADIGGISLNVDATSSIDLTGKGYLGGSRPGNGCAGLTLGNVAGSTFRSGGSYGGLGGALEGTPNPVYGSAVDPAALGSGGTCGANSSMGGNGGGWLKAIFGSIILNGNVIADGENGLNGYQAGNGSGGTINIQTTTLSGAGSIRANGFSPISGGYNEVGGGGGRIRISAGANSLSGSVTASGGGNINPSAAGTVVFQ